MDRTVHYLSVVVRVLCFRVHVFSIYEDDMSIINHELFVIYLSCKKLVRFMSILKRLILWNAIRLFYDARVKVPGANKEPSRATTVKFFFFKLKKEKKK